MYKSWAFIFKCESGVPGEFRAQLVLGGSGRGGFKMCLFQDVMSEESSSNSNEVYLAGVTVTS